MKAESNNSIIPVYKIASNSLWIARVQRITQDLMDSKTTEQVEQIRKDNILFIRENPGLITNIFHAKNRIRRIKNEQAKSYKSILN